MRIRRGSVPIPPPLAPTGRTSSGPNARAMVSTVLVDRRAWRTSAVCAPCRLRWLDVLDDNTPRAERAGRAPELQRELVARVDLFIENGRPLVSGPRLTSALRELGFEIGAEQEADICDGRALN